MKDLVYLLYVRYNRVTLAKNVHFNQLRIMGHVTLNKSTKEKSKINGTVDISIEQQNKQKHKQRT